MTTDFKATQVQTNKIIVTGSFANDGSNQLLIYNYAADDGGTPNQGVIDSTKFSTAGVGTDVLLYVSGGVGKRGVAGSNAISVFGGDLHVSGNLTVDGTSPGGGGGGDQYWLSSQSGSLYTSGAVIFRGPSGTSDKPSDFGSDIFFYVSGSKGNTVSSGVSVFGGNLKVSGSLGVEGNIITEFNTPIRSKLIGSNNLADIVMLADGSPIYGDKVVAFGDGSRTTGFAYVDSGVIISIITGSNTGFFSGSYKFPQGLSGSLTRLTNGTPYLIAGSGIQTSTGANGAVTISATGGGGTGDQYWQSSVSNQIFTTGSAQALYLSSSTGGEVTGTLRVKGSIVTNGGTIVDGNAVGQVFEDSDTSGNSLGLVVKNAGSGFGVPTLSLVLGSTWASGFVGGLVGWTGSPAFGLIPGINISSPSTYGSVGIRSGASQIARFNASGFQVTGSLAVQGGITANGGVVTNGGTSVDGGTTVGQVFEDSDSSGNSYGLVVKNSGTGFGTPFLSFVQGSTVASGYVGGILGWANSPAYGNIPGINLVPAASYPNIGLRIGSSNIARFNANGLQVTGTIATDTVHAATGITGSLTRLANGTPYLVAGSGIQTSTGSNGAVTISLAGTSGLATGKQYVAPYTTTTSTTTVLAGQFSWVPSDYTGLTSVRVRAIMSTDGTANHTGSLQIYNLTSGSYLDLVDTPTVSTFFEITSSIPTLLTSSNLLSGITNFNNSSTSIYEVRVSGSSANSTILGGVEIIFT